MKRVSGSLKPVVTVAMLLLQLVVGLVLPFYHARVEAQDLTHAVHISAPSESDCVPHNDIGCQICRSAGGHVLLLTSGVVFPPACSTHFIPRDNFDAVLAGQFELLGGFGPRAPPVV